MSTTPVRSIIPMQQPQGVSEASVIAQIGDIIRGSLITDKPEQIGLLLQSVIEQVKKQKGRYYIKNFWSDPAPLSLGYVGIHVKIRMPLSEDRYILMEIQIHPKQIMDGTAGCAKEIAHRLYKMPGEAAEEKGSSDAISSSQLIYLTSMVKLLCTREELRRVANTVDLIQAATKADKKKLLILETALLLNNEKLGHGEWNEELQAVVPEDKRAVATAWVKTATRVNAELLKLPVVEKDLSYSWTNTATSVNELYADAVEIHRRFRAMCKKVARKHECSANFGPGNDHMIKERKSLQAKINKDGNPLPSSALPSQAPKSPGSPGPAGSMSPKAAYTKLLIQLVENPTIQSDPALAVLLRSQAKELMGQKTQTLTPQQDESYNWVQELLVNGKVSPFVSESLRQLHARGEQKDESPVAPPTVPSMAPPRAVPVVSGVAFGAAAWNKYFGDVGVEPPMPPNIEQILSSPCPFFPGKTVRETQLLTLIPKTVDGEPFTLNSLGELVKRPKQGPATQYERYWDDIKKQYGDVSAATSYWVLLTKDVIPGSRNKSYDAQKQLVADYSRKTGMPYEVPMLLEAAAAIFMAHVQTGTRLYSNEPWTFTRCQERVATHPNWPLVVGGFGPGGLNVYDPGDVSGPGGVGGARKFS